MNRPVSWLPQVALVLLTAGCGPKAGPPAAEEPPVVAVSQPVRRDVIDYQEFTGRTDAVESVDVKARVTGYLVRVNFQAGAVVRGDEPVAARAASTLGVVGNPAGAGPLQAAAALFPRRGEGDLLFEIDPRPYKAALDAAEGQVQLQRARLKLANADYARAKEVAKTPGAMSPQDLDRYAAQAEETAAAVAAAVASAEIHRLNLEFTRITAPVSGRISRTYLTLGNLVNQDTTLLTTLVSEDPMYAYFDVDERTILRVEQLMRAGKIRLGERKTFPVFLGLANEAGYPHEGVGDFVNNAVSSSTGTISVRGVFANDKPAVGPRLLLPGEFVRIRLPLGRTDGALLVADRALGTDQGQKYLLVVDDKHVVQQRRVKVGALEDDGLRVIEDGLKPEEWVVVSGLQQAQPRSEVRVEEVAMPTASRE
jgi:multidrug efflux system membrane fusion protein